VTETEITEGRVDANGLTFATLEAGSGPLVLCVHGFPDSAWTWRHLLPALAEAGYRAVAPFQRGYAPTEVPADGVYQAGALVADATALHEALGGDEDAVIIGHDWGAFSAYGAIGLHPERWRRAVTLAVPPAGVTAKVLFDIDQLKRSWYMFFFQHPLADVIVAMDDLAFIDRLWSDWSPGFDASDDLPHVKDSLRDPANLAAALGYYRAMLGNGKTDPAYDEAQAAGGVAPPVPTLYLHGADDGCLGVDLMGDVSEHLPTEGSRVEIVPSTGHFLHVEDPTTVNAHILDFIGER